jgi:hypothetical protein
VGAATLPELIKTIFYYQEHDGLFKAYIAAALGIPEPVVNDACLGRLPGQVWADKASLRTIGWLAQHYPESLAEHDSRVTHAIA